MNMFICWFVAVMLSTGVMIAQDSSTVPVKAAPSMIESMVVNAEPAFVKVNGRVVATLRATVAGATPKQRAEATQMRVEQVLSLAQQGRLQRRPLYGGTAILLDGRLAVFLAPQDVDTTIGETLPVAVAHSEATLQRLYQEEAELRDVPTIMRSIGLAVAFLVVFVGLLRLIWWARRKLTTILLRKVTKSVNELQTIREILGSSNAIPLILSRLVVFLTWGLTISLLYVWLTLTLELFPSTRVWGEQMSESILALLQWFLDGVLVAIPDLAVVAFIFFIARSVSKFMSALLKRVETGTLHLSWIHADSIKPTKQIFRVIIWIFAFAFAYPYIPGSDSDAFRGVSVVAGLMLSFGGASAVGQALSGLILMYARTIRVGEFVTIGDHKGTVMHVGFFQTRLKTAYMEEILMPNSSIVSATVVNHSRLLEKGQTYSTSVTIGYDAPWRLIHTMLLEAAQRTANVATMPAPYVTQTSLQDFYIEYKLTVVFEEGAVRRETITALHGNIQDVFNANQVQIMSPHYIADPSAPKIVPPTENDPGLV
jgi:small-conductance mechanosensitive channel